MGNFGLRNAQSQNRESKLKIQYCSEARKEDSKDLSYMGHATSLVNKIVAPVQDILRPTIKETNIHDTSAERNFSSIQKLNKMYNLDDARTTLKEQLILKTMSQDHQKFLLITLKEKTIYLILQLMVSKSLT